MVGLGCDITIEGIERERMPIKRDEELLETSGVSGKHKRYIQYGVKIQKGN